MYYILGGIVRIPVMLNNTVHMVMYSYYLLSSMGPGIQRKINSYKKYITIMQMVRKYKNICRTKPHRMLYYDNQIILLKSILDKYAHFI